MADVFAADERRWTATGWPGVESSRLRDDISGGGASFFRLQSGAVIPAHDHPRGEYTYVLEGEGTFGPHRVRAGDSLYTRPGERHEVRALTELLFLGVAP